jgi:ABC-type glycerol-3-phosphate transport system substrate-binding protein
LDVENKEELVVEQSRRMSRGLTRRQFLAASAGAGAGLFLFGGCGGGGEGSDGNIINLWTHDDNYINFFKARAEELSKSDPDFNYRLKITQAPTDSLFTKALSALSAGTNIPDLLGIEISSFSRFMKKNIAQDTLLDITDRVSDIRDQYFESRWAPYSSEGRLYGVESSYPLSVYYYRKPRFDELGIETLIETWDDVLEIGKKVATPKGMYMGAVAAGGPPGYVMTHFGLLLQQRGGHFFDKDGNLALESTEAVEALELIVNGLRDDVFLGLSDFYGGPGAAAMKQGKVIGYFMPDWFETYVMQPTVPDQKGEWRIQPMPRFPNGGARTSVWGGTGFVVTKDSPVRDAAWKLLRYSYLTEENQIKRWEEIKYLPTNKEVWSDPAFKQPDPFLGGQRSAVLYGELADEGPTQYQSPNWDTMVTKLANELTEAYRGRKSPADAIKDAAAAIRAEMAES